MLCGRKRLRSSVYWWFPRALRWPLCIRRDDAVRYTVRRVWHVKAQFGHIAMLAMLSTGDAACVHTFIHRSDLSSTVPHSCGNVPPTTLSCKNGEGPHNIAFYYVLRWLWVIVCRPSQLGSCATVLQGARIATLTTIGWWCVLGTRVNTVCNIRCAT